VESTGTVWYSTGTYQKDKHIPYTLYINYYYLETVLILAQFVLLLTLSFFYLKASAVVDLEEEDDDLFQSARLEPEMSKFVGNTNGFSSRCTNKSLTYYFTSFSCYHLRYCYHCTHFISRILR
jgi:hypothetical protein